jgi:hypothetical protein
VTSDLTRIVTSLRRSPVYVAPSLASALPAIQPLLDAIKSAPVPVFAVIVPLVVGGEWTDAEHLTDAVHRRLGRDGVYLALDDGSPNEVGAWEYGVDRDAVEAAGAVNLDPAMDSASLTDRLTRCVQLITSGQAHAAYKKQSDALDQRIREDRPGHQGGGHAVAFGVGGGSVAVAAVAALLVWRQRRMHRVRRPRWRAVGGRERLTVRACPACARAVRARETPDVLRDGTTPYYEVDPERSVWATTGYGQFRGDLVQRVLRGDLRSS